MSLLISLVVLVLVFALLWYAISLLPLPASPPFRNILYVLLCVAAAVYLWSRFGG